MISSMTLENSEQPIKVKVSENEELFGYVHAYFVGSVEIIRYNVYKKKLSTLKSECPNLITKVINEDNNGMTRCYTYSKKDGWFLEILDHDNNDLQDYIDLCSSFDNFEL